MQTLTLHLFLLILLIVITTAAPYPPPYTPTDLILINCGASSDDASQDGRNWNGDSGSKFCPFDSQNSPAFEASQQSPSVDRVPFMTARIIHSTLTCTFPVGPGPKFVRLYFYPDTFSDLNSSSAFFTVTANDYTLLRNFSAYLSLSAKNQSDASLFKEFIVTVRDNQELQVTFTPSPGSFAFINGIEIVSTPNNLYTRGEESPYTFVNSDSNTFFFFDNTTSLQTFYRLNVGGQFISSVNDTGMFRTWHDDSSYISGGSNGVPHLFLENITIKYTQNTPSYTAPPAVYITKRTMGPLPRVNLNYNLTWIFPVDSGFNYLVRLHFCETERFIKHINQRLFFIFINNITAEVEADVFHWSGGRDIPVYKDYVVSVSGTSPELWLALHPNTHSDALFADAILNGLEIFKLNNSDGNLAGPNPELIRHPLPPELSRIFEGTRSKKPYLVGAIVGAVVGLIIASSTIIFYYRKKGKVKDTGTTTNKSSWFPFSYTSISSETTLALPTDLCRQFTMAEITAFTRNFHDQNVIGCGGFGIVYKGYLESGFPVAIKRLGSTSKQGIREFHTEIEMLSRLRHVHLVSLIGYCYEQGEMILVYEFMPHGNLQDHLYKTKNPPIPWKQRLQICIGAAKGLHYLHTGGKHTIIHRDVKSSNILLDRNWVAKVSDFGLSKTGPTSESQTHVSTVVRGSFGYLDPEYYRRQQLTEKSDVYSFGVVLLEVLCGRQPVISTLPREQVNLVEWARNCYRRGALDEIIDQQLKGDVATVCLNKLGEIAENCVREKSIDRPAMGDIVWGLEFALQLQENAEKNFGADDSTSDSLEKSFVQCKEVITTDDDDVFTNSGGATSDSKCTFSSGVRSGSSSDPDRVRSAIVFSEMMNPQGR